MNTFPCLSFLIVVTLCNGQVCSENIKAPANTSRYIALFSNDQKTYLAHVESDYELNNIAVFSHNEPTASIEENIPEGAIYAGHCNTENGYRLFYYLPNKNETFSLGGISGTTKKPIAENQQSIAQLTCGRKQLPAYIIASENSQGIYVYIPSYTNEDDMMAAQLLVLNSSMQVIREKKLTLPYGDNSLTTIQILPDSSGNIFLLAKQRQLYRSKNLPARYFLFYYNFQRNSLKEYDLQLHGRNITGAYLAQNNTNEIIVAGFYSDDMTLQSAGVFNTTIKPMGGSMSAIRIQPFNDAEMNLFFDQRTKKITIPDLELDGISIGRDGFDLWGERRYSTEHSGIDPLTGRVYNEIRHHNDQIVIAHIDASGLLKFNRVIHKQQITTGESLYMSYHLFHKGQSVCFAFNDNPSNQSGFRDDANIWHSSKNFASVCVEINHLAEIHYSICDPDDELRIIPRLCIGKTLVRGKDKTIRLCEYE